MNFPEGKFAQQLYLLYIEHYFKRLKKYKYTSQSFNYLSGYFKNKIDIILYNTLFVNLCLLIY